MHDMSRMDDEELKSLLQIELAQAIGQSGGKLSEDRRKLSAYYNGEIEIPADDGRS
jgi:hypothetical protein